MKLIWKLFVLISTIMILILSAGCSKIASNDDELIKIARGQFNVSDADTTDVQIAGTIEFEDSCLIWFITGNQYQAHSYFPIEFKVLSGSRYEFVKTYKPMDRGTDISVIQWNWKYNFLINNSNCKYIQITDENGQTISVEVEEIPFSYRYEGDISDYNFLDTDGNIVH